MRLRLEAKPAGSIKSGPAAVLLLTLFAAPATAQTATPTPHAAEPPALSSPPAATLPPPGWSTAEVNAERARCAQLLRGVDVQFSQLPPLREHECGAPAPIELVSVGRAPQVTFSPPVTVTCDLAAALAHWVKADVQPLARKYLKSEVVRIDTMSSYSCRTAYSRKNSKLSEHGKANAVDLRSFATAKDVAAVVLADWGPTGREIADQVAAAKNRPAAPLPAQAARSPQPPTAVATGSIAHPPANPLPYWVARPTLAVPGAHGSAPIGLGVPDTNSVGFANGPPPAHLGGPRLAEAAAAPDAMAAARTQFLRAAHDSACRVFGTTLGPEANSAHRNHFHVDMAERTIKAICE